MHHHTTPQPPKRRRLRPFLLLAIFLALGGLFWLLFNPGQPVIADCAWDTGVLAWVDENGDGRRDSTEPPLEGVRFRVDDIHNGIQDVGGASVSDWNGQAGVDVWLPGCPHARFKVLAEAPVGYRPKTEASVEVTGAGYGGSDTLEFGFTRNEGFPTPTPYVPGLTCTIYDQYVDDITIAPDGTVWIISQNGAARYEAQSDTWQTFPIDSSAPEDLAPYRIQVASNDTIWLSDGLAAARHYKGAWTYYTDYTKERNLIAASEPSIGTTSDGLIWFAPESPSNGLIAFDPASGTWKAFLKEHDYAIESVRLFTDGVVWRAALGLASEYTVPASIPREWKIYDRHVFSAQELLPPPDVSLTEAATIDKQDNIWMATWDGVVRFDPRAGKWQEFDGISTVNTVSAWPKDISAAPDGSIWVASSQAHALAFSLSPSTGRWQRFDPRDGIPDHYVNHIEVDHAGRVWFGFESDESLARCTRKI
jgi:streptogramin lyase